MLKLRLFRFLRWLPNFLLVVFVSGCATVLTGPTTDQGQGALPASESTKADLISEAEFIPPRPTIELTGDILFKILVAELAGQRNKIGIAVKNYLELARITRDPIVIERAARIAIYARDNAATYEIATLWIEIDPLNTDAHQVLTVIALRNGDIDGALQHIGVILDNTKNKVDQKLWMIANFLSREGEQTAVLQLMERLVVNHLEDPEALYAFAHIMARMGDIDRSQDLLERVLELSPDNEPATLSYISLLQKKGDTKKAIDWLEETLKGETDRFNLRMAYARLLTDAKRFDDARRQFEIISVQAPNNVDVLYALGLLYLQVDRLDDAERYFNRLKKLNKRVYNSNYYLGRIAEEKDEWDEASDLYRGVQRGEYYFAARIRLSFILVKQGNIDKALSNIRSAGKPEGIDRLAMIQAEGDILTDAKRYQEAMEVFNKAIAGKQHPDLLYSRAMLAEKMGLLNILEADLKVIISEDPDNATALNALGYILADRTARYDEAYAYIKRAYELSPDDFYILDSMGWILYRLGRLDEAVEFLQKAFKLRKDPEIATHLGEVLWVMGDKQAAKTIWETALKDTPTDDNLLKVIEHFKP